MTDVDTSNNTQDRQGIQAVHAPARCSYLACTDVAPLGCTLCPLHYLTRRLSMAGSRAQRLASDLAHGIPAGERVRVTAIVGEVYASLAELADIEGRINR